MNKKTTSKPSLYGSLNIRTNNNLQHSAILTTVLFSTPSQCHYSCCEIAQRDSLHELNIRLSNMYAYISSICTHTDCELCCSVKTIPLSVIEAFFYLRFLLCRSCCSCTHMPCSYRVLIVRNSISTVFIHRKTPLENVFHNMHPLHYYNRSVQRAAQ